MSIQIALRSDNAYRDVQEVHAKLSTPDARRALMAIVGRKAAEELRAWWQRRDETSTNKQGWPSQHFWARIREATNFDPTKTTDTTATVVVSDPALAAKINGATIKPRPPHRALAIPMSAAAYAIGSPGNPTNTKIPGLFFIRKVGEESAGFLVTQDHKAGPLTFWYRLVPQAVVPKDPQALPSEATLGAALAERAQSFFRRGGNN